MMRHWCAAGAAALLVPALLLAMPVRAANVALLWSLVASPTAVSTGVSTQFTLDATNGDLLGGRIECIIVDVPVNFDVLGASVGTASNGKTWRASQSGNRVRVFTDSGGGRLELLGESVRFWITARARSAGNLTWTSHAYEQKDCGGSSSLLGVPPVVLVTGAPVTPSPTPTASPSPEPSATPKPTQRPTATPRPVPTPSPPATRTSEPAASPAVVALLPSSAPPTTPAPKRSLGEPSQSPDVQPVAPAGRAPSEDSGGAQVAIGPGGLGLRTHDAGSKDSLDVQILNGLDLSQLWFVPAAVLGGPGLLVLLWVALQLGAGVIWLPAARRLRGDERRRAAIVRG